MKKYIFSIILTIIILSSCKKSESLNTTNESNNDKVSLINTTEVNNNDSDSVNLLELQTECDCIEAGIIVAKEIVSYDNRKTTSVQRERVNELKIKLKKIIKLSKELGTNNGREPYKGYERIKWSFHSCENFEEFDKINPIPDVPEVPVELPH